jgi:hypothetical protein
MHHSYTKEVHGSGFDQVTGIYIYIYMTGILSFLYKLSLLEDSFANYVFVTYKSSVIPLEYSVGSFLMCCINYVDIVCIFIAV